MVILLIWLACGVVAATIASRKGRSGCGFFTLGILLGPFGILVALVSSSDPGAGLRGRAALDLDGWLPEYALPRSTGQSNSMGGFALLLVAVAGLVGGFIWLDGNQPAGGKPGRLKADSGAAVNRPHHTTSSNAKASTPQATRVPPALPAGDTHQMPASERAFLSRYAEACEKYDSDASPDQRSTIAVDFAGADTSPAYAGDWIGTIAHIKMGTNGDLQDLLIRADSALFFMSLTRQYPKGSAVYQAATGLVEGQRVLFSANLHGATAVSERGQLCSPDFDTELTSIGPG